MSLLKQLEDFNGDSLSPPPWHEIDSRHCFCVLPHGKTRLDCQSLEDGKIRLTVTPSEGSTIPPCALEAATVEGVMMAFFVRTQERASVDPIARAATQNAVTISGLIEQIIKKQNPKKMKKTHDIMQQWVKGHIVAAQAIEGLKAILSGKKRSLSRLN